LVDVPTARERALFSTEFPGSVITLALETKYPKKAVPRAGVRARFAAKQQVKEDGVVPAEAVGMPAK
jgi:hypothetical protein